jgi:hypothetical protein
MAKGREASAVTKVYHVDLKGVNVTAQRIVRAEETSAMGDSKKVELKIEVTVSDSKMYFRTAGATAVLADGRQLAVEPVITGAGIVVTIRNIDKTSRTYYLDAQALGKAVLQYEDAQLLARLNEAMNLYEPKPDECICWKCLNGKNYAGMVLCPTCGNKRCPKASNHELACTNSNEPGQPGSMYGTIAPDEQPPET